MSTQQLATSIVGHVHFDVVTYLSWYIACFHTGES